MQLVARAYRCERCHPAAASVASSEMIAMTTRISMSVKARALAPNSFTGVHPLNPIPNRNLNLSMACGATGWD
jgi:hypothetical protein